MLLIVVRMVRPAGLFGVLAKVKPKRNEVIQRVFHHLLIAWSHP